MNRAAPAVIFIATVKLRVIELTHQNLQLHHPALLVRLQILGQTLLADEEVALRAAQEALRARRWLNFPGACRRPEPEPQLCVAFQQARLSTHRHHLTRSHLIMPLASPQLPSLKIDSLWTGRGIGNGQGNGIKEFTNSPLARPEIFPPRFPLRATFSWGSSGEYRARFSRQTISGN